MIDGLRVSVILPCLNEVAGVRRMLSRKPEEIDEIVVVDNNSHDATAAVARTFGARVVPESRPGYGWACRRGLQEASGDVIVKLDGDGTYDLRTVRPMVKALVEDHLDFVSGSRFPLQTPKAMTWTNRLGNWLLTLATNGCFDLSLSDSLSGMWAIRRSTIARLQLTQTGIPFSQEIKVEAFRLGGLRAREVSIPYHPRIGTSKLMPLRDGLGCLRYLVRRRLQSLHAQGNWQEVVAWMTDRVAFLGLLMAATCSPISLSLQEIGIGIATMAWLIDLVVRRRLPRPTGARLPLLLWLIAAVLSMGHAISLTASLRGLLKILKVAAVALVSAEVLHTPRRILVICSAIAASAALVSLDGLAQVIWGVDPLYQRVAGDAPGGFRRLTATFGHANDVGVYVASVLPLCLFVALQPRRSSSRWWWRWGIVALLSLSLPLTLSRAGVLATAAGLVVFGIIRGAWKMLSVLAVLATIALVCLPAPLREWAVQQGSWFNALVQPERPQMWQAALNMFRAHPFIGVGVNTFILNYARYRSPTDTLSAVYAHNHYLHMLAELGLVGFLAFGWLLVRTARVWCTLWHHSETAIRETASALGCSLVGFLVVGLLESALYSAHTNLYFWLCLGALYGLRGHLGAWPHGEARG